MGLFSSFSKEVGHMGEGLGWGSVDTAVRTADVQSYQRAHGAVFDNSAADRWCQKQRAL